MWPAADAGGAPVWQSTSLISLPARVGLCVASTLATAAAMHALAICAARPAVEGISDESGPTTEGSCAGLDLGLHAAAMNEVGSRVTSRVRSGEEAADEVAGLVGERDTGEQVAVVAWSSSSAALHGPGVVSNVPLFTSQVSSVGHGRLLFAEL